jgi:protein involved in polysaccharide export with SLBB domain
MLNRIYPKIVLSVLGMASLNCAPSYGQQQVERPRVTREPARQNYSVEQAPDFALDNLSRVGATAGQIRAVLARDAGLMVELKRWVAKEATDNGQIVEDASLTDEAVFERLDHDLVFRSVATRLAQRYGYLLPIINPESDAGKEQDLVLKERARRLVQIEAQEDSAALQPGGNQNEDQKMERAACNSQRDSNCEQTTPGRRRRNLPEEPTETEPNLPVLPEGPGTSINLQRMLRANSSREGSDGSTGAGIGTGPDLMMASNPLSRAQDGMTGMRSSGSLGGADGLAALVGMGNLPGLSPLLEKSSGDNGLVTEKKMKKQAVRISGKRDLAMEEDLAPVAMVHKPNPYADIPSLYDMYVQASPKNKVMERFGLEVFRNGIEELDAIPMDLPASPDYVVGPGDGLSISLWGSISTRFTRTVDREGRIALPETGPLLVSGRTLSDVQQAAQQTLRNQYRDVFVDVSLSRLRTVRVYVVGDVAEPGAYDISALSTVLNALFEAGGVTPGGSLRALKHYRGKELIEEVDTYDLLLHGVRGDMRRLENGDTLMVPPLGAEVTVEGMVRRPAVYELHGETTLEEALELAGGILPAAALQHIEVQRLQAHEKRTMLNVDVTPNIDAEAVTKQLTAFKIQDGDQIHVFPIAPYNESAIYLQGHVLRPGRYSYRDGMKLGDVIGSYADLLPEPAGRYAEIVRLNPPDYRPSVESFDLSSAMANSAAAPKLQPLDTIRIFSRYDFEPAPEIWVGGEVREPGKYRTSGQVHLKDAVYQAGGVTQDASLDSAQLFRTQPDGTMKILSVDLREALAGNPVDNVIIEPRDRLLIHRNSARVDPPTVYIKGEVAKPGRYPLTTNMRVEDLIRVAGGLKRSAFTESADLARFEMNGPRSEGGLLEVNLTTAMNGDPSTDVPMRDGDVLTIRQLPRWPDIGASMTVRGEVLHAGTYGIEPGERLSSVLARSGGLGSEAYAYGAVLMRREVRDIEMKAHLGLVQRVKVEEVTLKALPEANADEKNAKLTAIGQTEAALAQLQASAPIGRVVIHISPDMKTWQNTAADVQVRDGDVLFVPKKAGYVMVNGQVFNPTAISYRPGHSAKWYLSQAGGVTQLADKKAVFVVRADGSVIAAKNNNDGWWGGDPMSATLRAGDTIVVPEKAPKIGGRNWALIMQSVSMASSIALAVAYIHP